VNSVSTIFSGVVFSFGSSVIDDRLTKSATLSWSLDTISRMLSRLTFGSGGRLLLTGPFPVHNRLRRSASLRAVRSSRPFSYASWNRSSTPWSSTTRSLIKHIAIGYSQRLSPSPGTGVFRITHFVLVDKVGEDVVFVSPCVLGRPPF